MKRKRTRRITEISTEVKEVLLVTGPRDEARTWCPQCAMRVSVLTPDEAATALGTNARAILRQVEDGTLHSTATEHGLRICVRSLTDLRPEGKK
jgi:hypothetical protein